MSALLNAVINSDEKTDLRHFFSDLRHQGKRYLLRNDILNAFANYCINYQKFSQFQEHSNLSKLIYYTQKIIIEDGCYAI